MLKLFRKQLINHLWEKYIHSSFEMKQLDIALKQQGMQQIILDHFALIDLPGPHSGIPVLYQLFSAIGYREQGKDYLPGKQNDFLWMAEEESMSLAAKEALPQVVVADFRLDELPAEVKFIIEKYAKLALPAPEIKLLVHSVLSGNAQAMQTLFSCLAQYFAGRDWPLPKVKEFRTVHEFNELLAWVLIFGRKPNHFTLSIHLLDHFKNFPEFLHFVREKIGLQLNEEGGLIKGGERNGIAQSSTKGLAQTIRLADGDIDIPQGFVEFVWRYPNNLSNKQKPRLWRDYFTGFVAQHADNVIESLYL